MRFSYSIDNLRRLASTPSIEIRPITILLGRNSVGKSTFLRSLPLLRQSIETKSSAPVLWYGDYVDFGNFESAVTDKDTAKSIKFSFELKDYYGRFKNTNALAARYAQITGRNNSFKVDHLKISYSIGFRNESTERDKVILELPKAGAALELDFDKAGPFLASAKVNGKDLSELSRVYEIYLAPDSLFSSPFFLEKQREKNTTRLVGIVRDVAFVKLVEEQLSSIFDARFRGATISNEARRLLGHHTLDNDALTALSKTGTVTIKRLYEGMKSGRHTELHRRLNSLCQARYLFDLLTVVGESLQDFFASVEYIGPARARSERFYRQQELEVSEISPDGKNLPIFLASLDPYQQKSFSDWVERVFDYGVKVHKTEGHISINLEHRGQSINVVDTGYGVSQVLPVLAQIWWMQFDEKSFRKNRMGGDLGIKTLTIEQPELHLHPAHQALLADVFVEAQDAARNSKGPSQFFIVETHSEALINRLGELIETGKISAKDVQVVIFGDLSDNIEGGNVTLSEFDDFGVLQNWPYGFFNFSTP